MDSYGTVRLAAKNAESAIITRICEDFNLTPVLARAYYEQMARYFAEYGHVATGAGELCYLATDENEPPGKPTAAYKKVTVHLELATREDQELLGAKGLAFMRRNRLARLARRARAQGGLLTVEDLAYLTCSSPATVKRDMADGVFYVDGYARAYHGGRELPKSRVARIRLAMPAELDTWIADEHGDGVLVWSAPQGASLVAELRKVAGQVREMVGEEARPTICFDRGGWSPRLSKELSFGGFHILTYYKGAPREEPRSAFKPFSYTEDSITQEYLLVDRQVSISYDSGKRNFACRQIIRLDSESGRQTQVVTTRDDPDPAAIAHMMFSRWRQENFFRYMRAHYGLDALDSYEAQEDDLERMVTNPLRRGADRALEEARRLLRAAFKAPADFEIVGSELHVTIAPLSSPRSYTGILCLMPLRVEA